MKLKFFTQTLFEKVQGSSNNYYLYLVIFENFGYDTVKKDDLEFHLVCILLKTLRYR